jgi:S-DNA-T family DNA segregation ATPase FtsK/SpoIIIE
MVSRRRSVRGSSIRRAARRRSARRTLEIKVDPSVAREIWAVIYMAIGILTILSIKGTFGVIGTLWVEALKPVFGWGLYGVPAVFILISIMLFLSRKIVFGAAKILGMILLVVSVLSILHLSVPVDKLHEYAAMGMYGGYTGFVTNFLFLEVLGIGYVGASIIFIAIFLVSLLLMFELSLREIVALFVPKIRIEIAKEKQNRRGKDEDDEDDDEMDEEEMPEIQIHKAAIGVNKRGDIIYEGEEEEIDDAEAKKDKIVISEKKMKEVTEELSKEEKEAEAQEDYEWEFPSLDLLKSGDSNVHVEDDILMESADKIRKKLDQFGINVVMHEVNVGPTVIQFTLKPDEAVKLSRITALKNDMALALAAEKVRIEAPIPGKSLVGIEVPNKSRAIVRLREILESKEFTESKSKLTLPLGRDVSGKPMIGKLEDMPHLLVAGATGSGKSVAVNSFLVSLLYQNSPRDLKLILVDPKGGVELGHYNGIPHLLTPVIRDAEKAAISLRWVVAEMNRRYGALSEKRVRNVTEYNELEGVSKVPKIVVVIDELAELMMVAGKEVEASICRIAQLARAVGIHLIIATQRPSVDVVTGLIKANIPSRVAFAVSSQIDSRTILDGMGAEDLLGKGDMLYQPIGMSKPLRIQGVMITTEEVERVTNRIKLAIEPDYDESITSTQTASQKLSGIPDSNQSADDDELYSQAFEIVRETRKASASLFQRRLKVGYARAARLVDLLEENGVVGPADGAKPRRILID